VRDAQVELMLTQGAGTAAATARVLRRVLGIDNKTAAELAKELHAGDYVSLGTFEKGVGQLLRSKFSIAGVTAELRETHGLTGADGVGHPSSDGGSPAVSNPKNGRLLLAGAVVLAVVAAVVVVVATASHKPSNEKAAATTPHASAKVDTPQVSAEYALAQLDTGHPPTATEVAAYAVRLNQLGTLCTNPRYDISDIAVATRQVVKKEGRTATLAQILDGMATSIPADIAPTDCAQIAAAWATIYVSGG
jgi:hypothetical protein